VTVASSKAHFCRSCSEGAVPTAHLYLRRTEPQTTMYTREVSVADRQGNQWCAVRLEADKANDSLSSPQQQTCALLSRPIKHPSQAHQKEKTQGKQLLDPHVLASVPQGFMARSSKRSRRNWRWPLSSCKFVLWPNT